MQQEHSVPLQKFGAGFPARSWLKKVAGFMAAAGQGLPVTRRRRARVLAWVLLTLLLLLAFTIVEVYLFTGDAENRRALYLALLSGLLALLGGAFTLNHRGRYTLAAGITVAAALFGPWLAVLLDRSILQGDYIPLIYTTLSLFLCGILLPVQAIVFVAGIQFSALLLLSYLLPETGQINWPSLLAFILFTSVLSVVSNLLSREDMTQIDEQNRLLGELSMRDALTGLHNRRSMEEALTSALREAEQLDGTVGLVMVDVDHFKPYNDAYGHVAGDMILRLLGASMRANVRKLDVACRYGGEEFVLILPGATLEVTRERAELLRREAALIQAKNRDQLPGTVTLSMGVAVFPQHGRSAEDVLRAADSALYRAKDRGRDRVETAG